MTTKTRGYSIKKVWHFCQDTFRLDGLFVLGNQYPLYAYDRSGQARLRVPLSPASVKHWIEGLLFSVSYRTETGFETACANRLNSGVNTFGTFTHETGLSWNLQALFGCRMYYSPILSQGGKTER